MDCKTVAAAALSPSAFFAGANPASTAAVQRRIAFPTGASGEPCTTHAQVHDGADQSVQKESKTARRDRLVLEHLKLARTIAVRVRQSLPMHVDLDDLVHSGVLGLFAAASSYDSEKQVAFSTYAKHRIKGAILDSLRRLDWASRDLRRRLKQVEAVTKDLTAVLKRAPTESEVAEKLGIGLARLRAMMVDLRDVNVLSASPRPNHYDDVREPDFPDSLESQPDSIYAREELRTKVENAMKQLPERYQEIMLLYYKKEMTMKEIGGALGINESRVSQIHKSALQKMATGLETIGITSSQSF
jgi:RNA polymerase sigma factor for flagellar operon FliA